MKENYTRMSLYLPEKVKKWLETKAKADKRPFNQYVAVTLENMMEAENEKPV